ncbi:MAG: LysR family transcriptional regulator [Burkholderiaceae bacterium]
MRDRDLSELATFVAVVEQRGFSRAADLLGVTRQVLSRRVARLEARVGEPLLARAPGALVLTGAGTRVHREAVRVLAEREHAQVVAGGLAVEPTGTLTIAAARAFGRAVLLPVAVRFAALHPDVNVRIALRDAPPDGLAPDADVVVSDSARAPPGCSARLLARAQWRLVAAPGYLARAGTPAQPRDLASHRAVIHDPAFLQARLWHRRTRAVQAVALGRHLLVDDVAGAADALRAQAGIGPAPGYLVDAALADGSLVEVLRDWGVVHAAPASLYAIHRRSRAAAPKVSAFVDFAAAELAALRGR